MVGGGLEAGAGSADMGDGGTGRDVRSVFKGKMRTWADVPDETVVMVATGATNP